MDLDPRESVKLGEWFTYYLFAQCMSVRRDFHVDAYVQMSWCSFVCDPALRYDLRKGSFREGWEEIWKRLLATLIKPMVTAQWWQKELDVLERIVTEASFYTMHFDRTGAIVPELARLTR